MTDAGWSWRPRPGHRPRPASGARESGARRSDAGSEQVFRPECPWSQWPVFTLRAAGSGQHRRRRNPSPAPGKRKGWGLRNGWELTSHRTSKSNTLDLAKFRNFPMAGLTQRPSRDGNLGNGHPMWNSARDATELTPAPRPALRQPRPARRPRAAALGRRPRSIALLSPGRAA